MAAVEDSPPSYASLDSGLTIHKTASELLIEQEDAFFKAHPLPPPANYFVKADQDPSVWKLLAGPAMSNATTTQNPNPAQKRRYRIIYPPKYEDVYLHKSTWAANSDSLPRYHVELYGKNRYEPEPIVILGPTDHDDSLTNEAQHIAIGQLPRVFARIEDEITNLTRFATFCQGEYYSWDWKCKSAAASHDMRTYIMKAKKACLKCAGLVVRLEEFLDFVGEDEKLGKHYLELIRVFRRGISDSSAKLERLRL